MLPFLQMIVLAQTTVDQTPAVHVWSGPVAAAVYGLEGIALLLLGYKLFDLMTPQVHVQKELMQNNMAVGIVIAALPLGIAFIVAHVVA